MYLIEIYKSIQGESSFAGLPCIFVRLAGCNLRCSWCDSEYTFTGGYKLSEDEVVAEIEKLAPVRLIEFTGGEPMLQERELVPLMERLLLAGYQLMIETRANARSTASRLPSTRLSTSNAQLRANPPASASPISIASQNATK